MDWSVDRFGMGMVVRDSNSKSVAALIISQSRCIDPTSGEALASLHAVKFYKELVLSCIILEGDAQAIVQGVNSFERNRNKFGHIIEDIRMVL
jgi:ribonuclease HI